MTHVSIIVPTYNRRDIIHRPVESVVKQTYDDFELLIVDDGSTDGTETKVSEYTDPRIKYIKKKTNNGVSAARNTGIRESDGELLLFLDSDDELRKHAVEVLVDIIDGTDNSCAGIRPSYSLVRNGYEYGSVTVDGGKIHLQNLAARNMVIGGSGMFVRKDVFETVDPFDETMPVSQDLDLMMRILSNGYYLRGTEKLLLNVHTGGDSLTNSNLESVMRDCHVILNRYDDLLPDQWKSPLYIDIGASHLASGEREQAKRYFGEAVRLASGKLKTQETYLRIGITCAELNHTNLASSAFRKAIEVNPWRPDPYVFLIPSILGEGTWNQTRELYFPLKSAARKAKKLDITEQSAVP